MGENLIPGSNSPSMRLTGYFGAVRVAKSSGNLTKPLNQTSPCYNLFVLRGGMYIQHSLQRK
ncbi:hypothetical protein BC937DRAFT_91271 [Endogone sp. FLAS-F59071]|nr:hypothetical protein BC937DRAFT_91271 [Endogone sp. FLAS-F59071]|eukprot:RUS16385.1 hypothetical protein BC937DRAFT_91271 [Endogone sp. FLAS-F59071]